MALVLFENVTPSIGKITLNDPDNLNAMGEEMAAEFVALVQVLKSKAESLRVLVLTGSGRAFSAGGHLEMLEKKRQLSGEQNRLVMNRFYSSFLSVLDLGVPLIAAINGHAVGAGLCLASACDLRVVSAEAKLGFTFSRLGLHPGMGATYFLPRLIGIAAATELLLTGRVIRADEAHALGLVNRVVAPEALEAAVRAMADEIAECGPDTTRQLLETLRSAGCGLKESLEREALCQSISYLSDEFAEGVRAAREKRKAGF